MRFGLVFVLAVVLLAAASGPQQAEAARSKELTALLKGMMDKLNKYESEAGKEMQQARTKRSSAISDTKKEVSRLEKAYEKAEGKLEALQEDDKIAAAKSAASFARLEGQYNKERILIKRILGMLKHDVGTDASHPGRSCDDVFEHDYDKKTGNYWVLVKGEATKVKCVRKQSGRHMVSVGCGSSKRTSSWQTVCTDDVDFNSDKDIFQVRDSDVIVKKTGIYRINSAASMYAAGSHHDHMRIQFNGKTHYFYYRSHMKGWHTVKGDVTWTLKAGTKIQTQTIVSGGSGDNWNWMAKKGDTGYNRMQVEFLGAKDEVPFFSGGCTGHSRGGGWATLCLNQIEVNNGMSEYMHYFKDGRMVFKKEGFYRITADAIGHSSNGAKYLQLRVNGQRRSWTDNWNNGWGSSNLDWTGPLKADQTVDVRAHCSGSNPYRWHSHSSHGWPARIQVTYVGPSSGKQTHRMYSFATSSHIRNSNWNRMPNSQRTTTSATGKEFSVAKNGIVSIQKDGWYRVNARAMVHTGNWTPHLAKVLVNGKQIATCYDTAMYSWSQTEVDVTYPLAKGDNVQVYFRAQGSNPYIHQMSGHNEISAVEIHYLH